jgi:hypothetical protein
MGRARRQDEKPFRHRGLVESGREARLGPIAMAVEDVLGNHLHYRLPGLEQKSADPI